MILLLILALIVVVAVLATRERKPRDYRSEWDSCDYLVTGRTPTSRGLRTNLTLYRTVRVQRGAVRIVPPIDPDILWDALNGRR